MSAISAMAALRQQMVGLVAPPLPPKQAPFTLWFEMNRKKPFPVLIQEAGYFQVRMSRCYAELTEQHYDHARAVNFCASKALSCDIDATYHTALMGGEPYSDWN